MTHLFQFLYRIVVLFLEFLQGALLLGDPPLERIILPEELGQRGLGLRFGLDRSPKLGLEIWNQALQILILTPFFRGGHSVSDFPAETLLVAACVVVIIGDLEEVGCQVLVGFEVAACLDHKAVGHIFHFDGDPALLYVLVGVPDQSEMIGNSIHRACKKKKKSKLILKI